MRRCVRAIAMPSGRTAVPTSTRSARADGNASSAIRFVFRLQGRGLPPCHGARRRSSPIISATDCRGHLAAVRAPARAGVRAVRAQPAAGARAFDATWRTRCARIAPARRPADLAHADPRGMAGVYQSLDPPFQLFQCLRNAKRLSESVPSQRGSAIPPQCAVTA